MLRSAHHETDHHPGSPAVALSPVGSFRSQLRQETLQETIQAVWRQGLEWGRCWRWQQDSCGHPVSTGEADWRRWRREVFPGAGVWPGVLHCQPDPVLHSVRAPVLHSHCSSLQVSITVCFLRWSYLYSVLPYRPIQLSKLLLFPARCLRSSVSTSPASTAALSPRKQLFGLQQSQPQWRREEGWELSGQQ